ncbi:sugar (pentulose or hexulose) kinase [Sphingopyxis panaciterrae]|uniref:FGGY-family carbohydrate kinase n=1 Tax=Sphingopyxis panaciterrae TaxID=363841 RepID=UPI00141E1320|nr:carbohydrate kinase [Sphingopyxis panaciterrae]NIJ35875.1 sugar (pentulose or hexulose) kinase [Sphingopyxis panaciterrae]
MKGRATIILDVGKSLAKLSLWSPGGALIERCTRANLRVAAGTYAALDAAGIEAWVGETLRDFARRADVGAIVPVGHGAAAAIIRGDRLACPPLDYEDALPPELRAAYESLRDDFAETGSPCLPDGLNLGAQLFRLEALDPSLAQGTQILPWAQYWSWRLCGVAASEVTSLGCHTDLWHPVAGTPSRLAERRGWAKRLAPLRRAGEVLGTLTPAWAARTGLPADTEVHCGLHDSNAALLAARGFAEIAGQESTILSTGTWFVAMRSPRDAASLDRSRLDEARDCLINVDAWGKPIPSARFMGGREIETLIGLDTRRIAIGPDQPALLAALPKVLASGAMALPSFAPGFGPFPKARGRWTAEPADPVQRRAAVSLYAALVADASLELVGTQERLLIEGRFAEGQVFVRALAALRPDLRIYIGKAHNDVSYGALRLLDAALPPAEALELVEPLGADLAPYRDRWRQETQQMEDAA